MSCAMPSVSGAFGEKPTIKFPAESAPSEMVVQVLVEGAGPLVEAGDSVSVHYLGMTWAGRVFDSTFDRGAPLTFPIGVGAVIAGWETGVVGQSVGSRVVLSIPPRDAYGARGVPEAGIRGTDTLVFVIDVVSVEQSSLAGG